LAYGKSYPLDAQAATKFLKPFNKECGAEDVVGTPAARAIDV